MDYFIATNARILQTVHWALGTIVVVLISMAGVGWYVNFRLYRRDLDGLRKDLESTLLERIREIQHDIEDQVGTIAQKINETVRSALESDIEAMRKSVGDLGLRVLEMEFEREDEVPASGVGSLRLSEEVRRCCSLLKKAVELDRLDPFAFVSPKTGETLDKLTKAIEATLSPSALFSSGLDTNEVKDVLEVLSSTPEEFAATRDRIKELLNRALEAKTSQRQVQ
jgi:hypothetical protein